MEVVPSKGSGGAPITRVAPAPCWAAITGGGGGEGEGVGGGGQGGEGCRVQSGDLGEGGEGACGGVLGAVGWVRLGPARGVGA